MLIMDMAASIKCMIAFKIDTSFKTHCNNSYISVLYVMLVHRKSISISQAMSMVKTLRLLLAMTAKQLQILHNPLPGRLPTTPWVLQRSQTCVGKPEESQGRPSQAPWFSNTSGRPLMQKFQEGCESALATRPGFSNSGRRPRRKPKRTARAPSHPLPGSPTAVALAPRPGFSNSDPTAVDHATVNCPSIPMAGDQFSKGVSYVR